MARVHNWQLGREMAYPYRAAYPERQFAFVFNTNRCIACQSCTMACKSTWTFSKGQEHMWWANVETKPYGGYPMFWDMKILELLDRANPEGQRWAGKLANDSRAPYGRFEGRTIYEDNPVGERGKPFEWHKTGERLPEHKMWFFYLARICNHCTYPACLAACPRKAIYKRPEDGIVLIDQRECRGYRKCVEACPYKKSMYRGNTRISEKCVACYPRIEGKDPEARGRPWQTRCMAACIGQIRLQGLVRVNRDGTWAEDRHHPLYYLVHVAKVALPLYPQLGTSPNGYYIPPRWVPRLYLRQMFGPGVDQAIERYENPDRALTAVLQLFNRTREIVYAYKILEGPKVYEGTVRGRRVTLYNDTVIAYGKDGEELFRTSVEEPVHVRPAKHANRSEEHTSELQSPLNLVCRLLLEKK